MFLAMATVKHAVSRFAFSVAIARKYDPPISEVRAYRESEVI